MSPKQIDYFLRFKEDPKLEPTTLYKREFTLDCKEVFGVKTRGNNYLNLDGKYHIPKGCYKFKFSFSNQNPNRFR